MPPPPPPVRTKPEDYHFYAYEYDDSHPYTLSKPVTGRKSMQFYSMFQDVLSLYSYGLENKVPNIEVCLRPPIQQDGEDRRILVLTFGGDNSKPKVLLTGGIHAREWVAPAITYLIAEYLIINYTTDPENKYQEAIKNLIDNRHITIMPMLNPHGNMYSIFSPEKNARMWRRNRRALPTNSDDWIKALTQNGEIKKPNPPFWSVKRISEIEVQYTLPAYKNSDSGYEIKIDSSRRHIGVDLNRNFDTTEWGYETGTDIFQQDGRPGNDGYFGPNRSSEDETKILQEYMSSFIPDAAIDYHSYSKLILYPANESLVNENYTNLGKVVQTLIAPNMGYQISYDYALGSTLKLIGYDALGAISDYQAERCVSRAYCIELDPSAGIFSPGFELPENQIMAVFEKNIRAALALIAEAGNKTSIRSNNTFFMNYGITMLSAAKAFLDWNVFGRGNQLPEEKKREDLS